MALEVTPAELRASANHLQSTSDDLQSVLTSLTSSLAGVGPAWGDDDPGNDFATGGEGGGYLGQLDSVTGAITAKRTFLSQLSEGMTTAADKFESEDSV